MIFWITKLFFFHFFSFWPFLLHQCITFSFFFGFKLSDLNCFEIIKSSCTSKGNKIIFKEFLRCSKIGYELFDWECFGKMIPSTLGGHNFLIFSSFLSISSGIHAQRGRLRLLFGHHKQCALLQKRREILP
jgi:hypothetical protein